MELQETTGELVDQKVSTASIILNSASMQAATAIAEMMADKSQVTIPEPFQGQVGDCMAIVLQAMNWGMNPFVVAQSAFVVNGKLGYSAQLVNAVVSSGGHITGTFKYQHEGEAADYSDLRTRVGAVVRGESEITWGEWLSFAQVTTKNSPLWKTNARQQMGYLQIKNWARAYCPQAILGVYTNDELQSIETAEIREINPKSSVTSPRATPEKQPYSDEQFEKSSEAWQAAFLSGLSNGRSPEDFFGWAEAKGAFLTDKQKDIVLSWVPVETVDAADAADTKTGEVVNE